MRSRRARALHTCLAPRNNAQHYIFLNRAGTSGRAPSRSRRQKARPSAGKQHHQNLCLTTPSSPPSTSVGRAPDSACTRSSSHLHPDAWVCRPSGNFSQTAVGENPAWFENYLITTTTAMRAPWAPAEPSLALGAAARLPLEQGAQLADFGLDGRVRVALDDSGESVQSFQGRRAGGRAAITWRARPSWLFWRPAALERPCAF